MSIDPVFKGGGGVQGHQVYRFNKEIAAMGSIRDWYKTIDDKFRYVVGIRLMPIPKCLYYYDVGY